MIDTPCLLVMRRSSVRFREAAPKKTAGFREVTPNPAFFCNARTSANQGKLRKKCRTFAELLESEVIMAEPAHGPRYSDLQQENATLRAENLKLRELMWLHHGHDGLYGDDGCMQCARCMTDFKTDSIDYITKTYKNALRAEVERLQQVVTAIGKEKTDNEILRADLAAAVEVLRYFLDWNDGNIHHTDAPSRARALLARLEAKNG